MPRRRRTTPRDPNGVRDFRHADARRTNDLPADKQIEFYQHEVGWANRLILGDSLLVVNSLLVQKGMGGKVQMIHMDPPYGIKYSSNFQNGIDRRSRLKSPNRWAE